MNGQGIAPAVHRGVYRFDGDGMPPGGEGQKEIIRGRHAHSRFPAIHPHPGRVELVFDSQPETGTVCRHFRLVSNRSGKPGEAGSNIKQLRGVKILHFRGVWKADAPAGRQAFFFEQLSCRFGSGQLRQRVGQDDKLARGKGQGNPIAPGCGFSLRRKA